MKFVGAAITRKTIDGFRLQKLAAHRPINDAIDFRALQISNELKCECFTQRSKSPPPALLEEREPMLAPNNVATNVSKWPNWFMNYSFLIHFYFQHPLPLRSVLLAKRIFIVNFALSPLPLGASCRAQPQLLPGTSFRGKHFMLAPRQREMFVNYVGPNELFNAASCVGYSAINFVFTLARRLQHRVYQWSWCLTAVDVSEQTARLLVASRSAGVLAAPCNWRSTEMR